MSADRSESAGEPTAVDTESAAHTLGWTGDTGWATLDRPAGVVGLGLALVTFWLLGGLAGVLAWLVLAGTWLLAPPVVAVALGQFLLVALVPADAELLTVLPAEGALLGLLAADFIDSGAWLPDFTGGLDTRQNLADALGYAGGAIALSALVVGVWRAAGALVAGGLCLGLVAVVGYGLRPALAE